METIVNVFIAGFGVIVAFAVSTHSPPLWGVAAAWGMVTLDALMEKHK